MWTRPSAPRGPPSAAGPPPPPAERAARITALRAALGARREEIAETVTAELGSPLAFSRMVSADLPTAVAASYAELLETYAFSERIGNSTVHHEPVGVVGAITPWNYPLHQIVAKVVPALAAGCTVVLKPAEDTPLVARIFAEAVHEAGFPAGVFNLVTGRGPVAGAGAGRPRGRRPGLLHRVHRGRQGHRRHRRRDRQTGRPRTRRQVRQRDPARRRPEDRGQGRHRQRHGQLRPDVQRLDPDAGARRATTRRRSASRAAAAAKYVPADPAEPGTRIGPVVNARQRERVRGYIARGLEEGARLVAGGAEPPEGLERGYYVRPTVFADVTEEMAIAQEEIFGPVVSIMRYADEEEALRIANGTVYGLAGAVWCQDEDKAVAFARRMDTGQVDINGGRFNPRAPFGGYKQSGVGRELGPHGLAEFLQTKSLQF